MDFQTRKTLYNQCDPFEALAPTDRRYLAIERQPGGNAVRGDDWVAGVQQRLQLSDTALFELLTGLPGSGKSTELRRLALDIADPHAGAMLPVYIDAESHLDLSATVDVADVLATIVEQAERAVLELEKKDPAAALRDGFLARTWNWLSGTDVELKKAEFAVPDVSKLTVELKTRPTLRQRVREVIAIHLTRFVDDVHLALRDLNSRAVAAGRVGGIVILYDSLEKLRGTSTSYETVLDSCERMFAQGARFLRLPVHVIYTAPPALLSRAVMRDMAFFPMLKLRQRDGTPCEPGLAIARNLVFKRVPEAQLAEQLGPEWPRRLDRLLLWSGGFPREIVRLLRNIVQSEQPLTDEAFDKLLSRITSEYRDLIRTSDYPWLAKVAVSKQLASGDDDERKVADKLVTNGAVFRYVNGGDWWDVHPAVLAIEGVKKAIAESSTPAAPATPDGHD